MCVAIVFITIKSNDERMNCGYEALSVLVISTILFQMEDFWIVRILERSFLDAEWVLSFRPECVEY